MQTNRGALLLEYGRDIYSSTSLYCSTNKVWWIYNLSKIAVWLSVNRHNVKRTKVNKNCCRFLWTYWCVYEVSALTDTNSTSSTSSSSASLGEYICLRKQNTCIFGSCCPNFKPCDRIDDWISTLLLCVLANKEPLIETHPSDRNSWGKKIRLLPI